MIKKLHIILFILGSAFVCNSQIIDSLNKKSTYLAQYDTAQNLIQKKQYKKAIDVLTILLKKDDIDIIGCNKVSQISNSLGLAKYFDGNVIKALREWKENTIFKIQNCDTIDYERLAQTYYNIGYCYSKFNSYKYSNKYMDSALSIIDSIGAQFQNSIYAIWCVNRSGNSSKIGDFNLAEVYAFKALKISNNLNLINKNLKANIYLYIGRIFINKNENDLAKIYLDKSLNTFPKSDTSDLIELYSNFAVLCDLKKQFKKSISFCNKALALSNKKDDFKRIYSKFGLTYSRLGNPSKALNYFFKSLNLVSKKDRAYISNLYENISGAYGRLEELDSALYFIDLSIDKLHILGDIYLDDGYKQLKENDFSLKDMIRKLQMKGKFLTRKYKKEEKLDYLVSSSDCFSKADSLIFVLRNKITDKDSKILFGDVIDTVYRYAIENDYLLWKLTNEDTYIKKVYKYISENKAIVFSETKEELNAVWDILDPKLRKDYLKIMDDLKSNMYEKQYAVLNSDTIAYNELNYDLSKLTIEKEKLFTEIKQDYPQFYEHIYGVNKQTSIQSLQNKLESDNAIIEYYIDGDNLYTFLISKDSFLINKEKTELNLDNIFADFSIKLSLDDNTESIAKLSKIIYPLLFPKKVEWFLEKKGIKRLILIRDKNINLITFAPIVIEKKDTSMYLISKYALSYSFNNKYIWNISKTEEKKEYEYGGFATRYDEKTLEEITKDSIFWNNSSPPKLSILEQSVSEISEISKLYKSELWIGQEASALNFKNNAKKYKVLHLSLHSIIASGNNEQNAMVFQKTKDNENFVIKSSDILGLRLNNQLSVLSSCFTSDGSVISGEGIKSLARSFAIAGSPSIIASQWQAYEGQTRYILELFFKYLKKGYSKDVSMQKAQLEFIKSADSNFKAPVNWASLLVIGDPIAVNNSFNTKYIYLILLFLGIFLILFTLKRKISKKTL